MNRMVMLLGCMLAAGVGSQATAQAQKTVAILLPGAGGAVPQDFLVRNKARFDGAGFDTVVTTSTSGAVAAANAAQQSGRKAVIVGMSRGAPQAASALASGAKVAGVVFVSGVYGEVISNLGSPQVLPPTLVVHHRADQCPLTTPELAERFVRWARGKASIRWINTVGAPDGRPCAPFGAHGFFQQDGPAVAAIVSFIRSR